MKIADLVSMLTVDRPPVRFSAYDGSHFGPQDAPITLELKNERGLRYLAAAPGDLGLARAYVSGDLMLHGAQFNYAPIFERPYHFRFIELTGIGEQLIRAINNGLQL